ncbi:MAG: amylo-alpha-1,6-glucosidase [Candidatus Acidiferrales bacterium]
MALALAAHPAVASPAPAAQRAAKEHHAGLELTRAARPWEFLGAFGPRAGVFGYEDGRFEVWAYPLKILRDLRLRFHVNGQVLDAAPLARSVSVRPGSGTIVFAGDTFLVRQTVFAPPQQAGAVFQLEIETAHPLEIEAQFQRDFQLMWPAAIGGTYMSWDDTLRAFTLGEEQRRFFAIVGSPDATEPRSEYFSNSASSEVSSFRLGRLQKGRHVQTIAIAASFDSREDAANVYRSLSTNTPALRRETERYYRDHLDTTLQLRLPDSDLQAAYDWSRLAMFEGLVTNPFLGTGLIAGYRTSGRDARPGFAWFFGRDSLWTAWALVAADDFATARTALDFISRFQRDDGKMPHEISQSAKFVRWFEDYPYGYASADSTPLYILTMNEYATASGDTAFAREKWQSVWKAYEFLRSTFDENGFAKNQGVGHGWVEGGPLLPVKTEYYQSGLGVAALKALANLARTTGKAREAAALENDYEKAKQSLEQSFWLPEENIYAFALDQAGRPVATASVLATVPVWFDLPSAEHAQQMIDALAGSDHLTDWGMRILSSTDTHFRPEGYHYGSVWPLFTGWASVGEYRYHRAHAGYANLRANVLLALDGSLGRVTEVLSGAQYAPLSTTSPHQIWSAAMVVSPLLRGLLGLERDAAARRIRLAPHLPAHWREFEMTNLRIGDASLQFKFTRDANSIALEWQNASTKPVELEFSPAVSLRAKAVAAEVNDRPVPFDVQASSTDQHVRVRVPLPGGRGTLRIGLENDFAFHYEPSLPPPGEISRNLKIVSQKWSERRDRLEVEVEGRPGREYVLFVGSGTGFRACAPMQPEEPHRLESLCHRDSRQVLRVEGGTLEPMADGNAQLHLRFDAAADPGYVRKRIAFVFSER